MGRASRRVGWLLACLLACVVALGAVPGVALAAEVTYVDVGGGSASVEAVEVTTETESWGGDDSTWYVAQGNVTISSRVSVTGDVNLILADNATLTVNGGIRVSAGNSLTIYGQERGTGKLTATGGDGNAGIGGNYGYPSDSVGAITINGGTVVAGGGEAGGGNGGAGIGSGVSGSGGTTNINGGTVTATGAWNAAGIGGGTSSTANFAVTITGGTVTATGGGSAVGIGGSATSPSGGTFSTGEDGDAVIFASSIGNQSNKSNWSGVIFEDTSGQVYAAGDNAISVPQNWSVPADCTLTVPWDVTLEIPAGVRLDVEGTLINEGTIEVAGTLDWSDALLTNNGVVTALDGSSVTPTVPAFKNNLAVTGGVERTDYDFRGAVLVILSDTPLTVTGETKAERIVVGPNVQANLTLSNVSIDIQSGNAIDLLSGASLNLTLVGENILKPGGGKAGIHVPSGTSLTIGGPGSLSVDGGRADSTTPGGAGIGADPYGDLGTIVINGGTVVAQSTKGGSAGIGAGGWAGDTTSSSVTINGGNVTASAADGNEGSINAATVTINGGVVYVPDDKLDGASKSNCIVFKNGTGHVYASDAGTVTIAHDWEVPSGYSLTVPSDPSAVTLVVPESVTLKVAGALTWTDAKIENRGTIELAEKGSVDPALVNVTVADVAAEEDATVTLTATVSSIGTLDSSPGMSLQWQQLINREWENVGDATGEQLALGSVTKEQDGTRYRCVVTLGGCTAYSAPATLTVTEPVPEPTPPVTPPSRPTYEPEVPEADGGAVEVSPSRPHRGDTVTVTPEPEEGQEVRDVVVTDKDGEPVEVTDNGDGTWTFEQPAGKVTITVAFGCDGGELCPGHAFADVDPSAWYHDAVDWAVTSGAILGYADTGLFGPDDALTRAQMATILCRLAEDQSDRVDELPPDVPADAWYAGTVSWALASGVFNGNDDGTFSPDEAISREQVACVLYNRAAAAGQDVSARADLASFPDASEVSGWAREAMSWAVAEGVFSGAELPDGSRELQPARALTRAEGAAVLMNWEERA